MSGLPSLIGGLISASLTTNLGNGAAITFANKQIIAEGFSVQQFKTLNDGFEGMNKGTDKSAKASGTLIDCQANIANAGFHQHVKSIMEDTADIPGFNRITSIIQYAKYGFNQVVSRIPNPLSLFNKGKTKQHTSLADTTSQHSISEQNSSAKAEQMAHPKSPNAATDISLAQEQKLTQENAHLSASVAKAQRLTSQDIAAAPSKVITRMSSAILDRLSLTVTITNQAELKSIFQCIQRFADENNASITSQSPNQLTIDVGAKQPLSVTIENGKIRIDAIAGQEEKIVALVTKLPPTGQAKAVVLTDSKGAKEANHRLNALKGLLEQAGHEVNREIKAPEQKITAGTRSGPGF